MVGKDPLCRVTGRMVLLVLGSACFLALFVGTTLAPAPAWADDPTAPPAATAPADGEDLELAAAPAGAARTGPWAVLQRWPRWPG